MDFHRSTFRGYSDGRSLLQLIAVTAYLKAHSILSVKVSRAKKCIAHFLHLQVTIFKLIEQANCAITPHENTRHANVI
jgi:hypothetical protein